MARGKIGENQEVVWVTGASSGIGEALARELAGRGARLVLSSRGEERLEEVRASLPHPERHRVVPLDLGEPESLREAARRVLEGSDEVGDQEGDGVDVLVHNGGISQRSRAEETSLAVDRKILEVDYLGAVALTKEVLPSMLERGSGRIVVVSSLVGHIGTPLRSAYSAAKHALHGFFDSLRAEVHDRGVRVTMVCPGFIRTRVSVNALTGDGTAQGTMDRAQAEGMSAQECARRIVRAIDRGRDEVLIGGKEVWAVRLHRLVPGLYRSLIRRVRVT